MENRVCRKCGESKPLDADHFYKHKHMTGGFAWMCKTCAKEQQVHYSEVKAPHREKLRRYRSSDSKKGLENDLTVDFVNEAIKLPCTYCGTTDAPRGLDRLDNSLGHLQSNVVPCCALCNTTRMDNYTPAEMKLLGAVIAQIRTSRNDPSIP